ncbi:copper chaperone CopZ [Sporolactobacillus pectinivorans]|uniref:copper chaperone CopZ n=1 Tax=Sporolactobacillus pectinivorans TaxID=1591408 RepID=UPI000C25B43A|nr:copper chaperone CopZ [Sporolactobacillus pectinivorans]
MAQTTLDVKGMHCGHCKMSVTNALKELDGVSNVSVNLEKGKAVVEYDETKVQFSKMKEAVEEQGYDVVGQN